MPSYCRYQELWKSLGAYPVGIRPTILQTAIPSLADSALLRFMGDVNRYYGSHCLTHGRVSPVLVHTFSNAGFLAFGTMLHLASLLDTGAPWSQGGQQLHHTTLPDDAGDAFLAVEASSMSSTTKL